MRAMSAGAEERRARRAREMVFAKATTFAQHEEQSIAYWRAADPSLKFQAIVELVQDSHGMSRTSDPTQTRPSISDARDEGGRARDVTGRIGEPPISEIAQRFR